MQLLKRCSCSELNRTGQLMLIIGWHEKIRNTESETMSAKVNKDYQVSICLMCYFFLRISKINHPLIALRLRCNSSLSNCRFSNEKFKFRFFSIFLFQLDFVANLLLFLVLFKFFQCMYTLIDKYKYKL